MTESTVLEACGLSVRLHTDEGKLEAASDVSFMVRARETLALVGESGAGKSITSLAIMRLLQSNGRSRSVSISGRLLFRDRDDRPIDLLTLQADDMRRMRGRAMAMIFQEPMTCLNPVMRVGDQIAEAILAHEPVGNRAAMSRATDLLRLAGIPDSAARVRAYPHELSGGMRQRVMIAMALACHPRLLIADEPTTALDVTVQAQVLGLIRRLQQEFGMAVLFITHDLGVVAQMADRVAIMYAGRIVEQAPVEVLFSDPKHPYSQGLLSSMPDATNAGRSIRTIPGGMPALNRLPAGCAFHPRCTRAIPALCNRDIPPAMSSGSAGEVRCWLHLP